MRHLPPLRLLITFDAVQRYGSMQLAAAELNVTRPAVSQAIKALEDEVGVVLFNRGTRPATPTEAGDRLARATRFGLAQISDAIEDIRMTAGVAGGQVTVSCTLGMASYWLMPRLSDFYARFPDTMVNVQTPPSNLPAFSSGIDIALRYGPTRWDDGETVRLFAECVSPVGRPSVIESLAGDLRRLRTAKLIHVRSPPGHHWAGWAEYYSAKGIEWPTGPRQTFDNYVQATQAAQNGLGVLLGWRSITGALVADGSLMALPDASHDFGTAYWVTCARDSLHKPAARSFMEWISSQSVSAPNVY